jgi:hypothetical protein
MLLCIISKTIIDRIGCPQHSHTAMDHIFNSQHPINTWARIENEYTRILMKSAFPCLLSLLFYQPLALDGFVHPYHHVSTVPDWWPKQGHRIQQKNPPGATPQQQGVTDELSERKPTSCLYTSSWTWKHAPIAHIYPSYACASTHIVPCICTTRYVMWRLVLRSLLPAA